MLDLASPAKNRRMREVPSTDVSFTVTRVEENYKINIIMTGSMSPFDWYCIWSFPHFGWAAILMFGYFRIIFKTAENTGLHR